MKDYRELFGYEDTEPSSPVRQFFGDIAERYRHADAVGKLMYLFRGFLWTIFLGFGLFGLLVQFGIIK